MKKSAEPPRKVSRKRQLITKPSRLTLLDLHPDHLTNIKRINRVIGQLQGIQRMIEDRRYCPDILIQTRAASSALKAIELSILEKHLSSCVISSLKTTNNSAKSSKISELIDLFARF